MDTRPADLTRLATATRRCAQRLLIIGENRLVLLAVEVQEERERMLHLVLAALALAAVGLLGGMALSALIIVLLWPYAPVLALVTLTLVYAASAGLLYRRIAGMLRDWRTFPESLEQLRQDRACLDAALA